MFRALFETAPDAMIVVDRWCHIVLSNRQTERLFGYAATELVGQPIEILLPDNLRGAHRAQRDDYMLQPRVRPMGTGRELTARRQDGTLFPVEIALSPIESEQGPHFAASIRDISETQRARQALVRARYDAFAAQIGRLALESPSTDALAEGLPGLVATALQIDAVALLLADGQRSEWAVRAAIGMALDVLGTLPRLFFKDGFSGPRSTAVRCAAIEDFAAEPPSEEQQIVIAEGLRSGAVVPLFDLDHPVRQVSLANLVI